MYIKKPRKINTEVLRALRTPAVSFPTSGINLKNLKALKTLIILNTSRKLKSTTFKFRIKAKSAGIDNTINMKSNLFQLDEK